LAFSAVRPGLGVAVSSFADLHGLALQRRRRCAGVEVDPSWPSLPARARSRPPPPVGSPRGSSGEGARPVPAHPESCRAVVPSQQRSILGRSVRRRRVRRRRAPGGAAAGQVPRPGSRGSEVEPDAWSGVAVFQALRPLGLPKQSARPVVPGIVDSSPSARPSPAFPPGEVPRGGLRSKVVHATGVARGKPQAACHVESCRTPLMVISKTRPSVDIPTACPLPARCRPRPNEVLTGVSTLPADASNDGFSARLRPEAATPRVLFRPCRFSRLRRLAPHNALRVCCTPLPTMGFAWLQAPDVVRPSPCKHVLSRASTGSGRIHP
jgi:hypothetical protein